MLSNLELMDIHVRALFTHDADARLLFVNEPDGLNAPAPRLFLGRTQFGNLWRFRADLPEKLCEELSALCADEPPVNAEFNEPPRHLETYIRLLEKDAPVGKPETGPAYYFSQDIPPPSSNLLVAVTEKNAEILLDGFEEFVAELPDWQPFIALIEENRAVSICRSARITGKAHEAGVETLPDFRGKGYAKEVAAEWARRVQSAGAIPMYSTSWENKASQAVARKLRLNCYGADFHLA
ncbi:MAG TPA: GNAT family N-acetyltransferase [Pyrinomonadaceae bacterium]